MGRVGPAGTHAPPPQRPSSVGEGAAALGARPVRGRGWGASPPPTPSGAGPAVSPAGRPRPASSHPRGLRAGEGRRGSRQPAIAARRPTAHLPAVFAVAAPTAAPSSSPPRARAAAGASRNCGQALTAAGTRCVEEPGPRDWSAEAAGGRSGATGEAPNCRCESAPLRFPLSASRPEGEDTRAAAARTGTSLARFPPQPARRPHRCLPLPLPHCSQGRSAQAR